MPVYQLSRDAAKDLHAIAIYTVDTFGAQQAQLYADGLEQCLITIADNPFIGRERGHIRPSLRSFKHESHVIYYLMRDSGLYIVRVLHNRQKASKHR
jgi:toxin ParE1/3/4